MQPIYPRTKQLFSFLMMLTVLLLFSCTSNRSNTVALTSPKFIGPKKGTLIIIGGHATNPLFLQKFKEFAGGDSANIIVVPTAWDDQQIAQDSGFVKLRKRFERVGFRTITILHTRDPKMANTDKFIEPIKHASGVYFLGGRQWRIADGFLNTRAHEEFRKLLQRGGVIAGSSAGASIQASFLARGDTKTNTIMMGDHQTGLDFLKNTAIDQHILVRNRQFDLFKILKAHPGLLGIGLDENTGIVVKGNIFKVIGNSYVAIYDGTLYSRDLDTIIQLPSGAKEFYFLRKGDKYDLKNRKALGTQD